VTALAQAVESLDMHLVRMQGARFGRTLHTITMPTSKDLVACCAADGEFALAGSTFGEMKGVGHFPMAENPAVFLEYLLPVLEQIRIAAAAPGARNPAKVDR
jgi:pimeloyl-ACP methyl ester carboxylesterase